MIHPRTKLHRFIGETVSSEHDVTPVHWTTFYFGVLGWYLGLVWAMADDTGIPNLNVFTQVLGMISMLTPGQRQAIFNILLHDDEAQAFGNNTAAVGSSGNTTNTENVCGEDGAYMLPRCTHPCERKRCRHQGRAICGFPQNHGEHKHTCADCNSRYWNERHRG